MDPDNPFRKNVPKYDPIGAEKKRQSYLRKKMISPEEFRKRVELNNLVNQDLDPEL